MCTYRSDIQSTCFRLNGFWLLEHRGQCQMASSSFRLAGVSDFHWSGVSVLNIFLFSAGNYLKLLLSHVTFHSLFNPLIRVQQKLLNWQEEVTPNTTWGSYKHFQNSLVLSHRPGLDQDTDLLLLSRTQNKNFIEPQPIRTNVTFSFLPQMIHLHF